MLIGNFIFEVADSGRETTVGSHIGIANESETHFEVERLVENFLLKDHDANHLAEPPGRTPQRAPHFRAW